MLGPDHNYGEIARQRHVDALLAGDNARLARNARLHTAAAKASSAPAPTRRSFLVGWWHGLAR